MDRRSISKIDLSRSRIRDIYSTRNRVTFADAGFQTDTRDPAMPETAGDAPNRIWEGFGISRALAKTITFRTAATAMDFATNYVIVGDVASAVVLSATGFVLGPFVYYGHEKAWEYFSRDAETDPDLDAESRLLPASIALAAE